MHINNLVKDKQFKAMRYFDVNSNIIQEKMIVLPNNNNNYNIIKFNKTWLVAEILN